MGVAAWIPITLFHLSLISVVYLHAIFKLLYYAHTVPFCSLVKFLCKTKNIYTVYIYFLIHNSTVLRNEYLIYWSGRNFTTVKAIFFFSFFIIIGGVTQANYLLLKSQHFLLICCIDTVIHTDFILKSHLLSYCLRFPPSHIWATIPLTCSFYFFYIFLKKWQISAEVPEIKPWRGIEDTATAFPAQLLAIKSYFAGKYKEHSKHCI